MKSFVTLASTSHLAEGQHDLEDMSMPLQMPDFGLKALERQLTSGGRSACCTCARAATAAHASRITTRSMARAWFAVCADFREPFVWKNCDYLVLKFNKVLKGDLAVRNVLLNMFVARYYDEKPVEGVGRDH
jgi:hypothetical protein